MQPNEFVDGLRESWQLQPAALTTLTSKLLRKTLHRSIWEGRLGGAVRLVFFSVMTLFWAGFALVSETILCHVGCALLSAGNLYSCYWFYRLAWIPGLPADRGLAASLTFYRAHLIRQRDFFANALLSTMLAQAPGAVLAVSGWLISSPEQWVMAGAVGLFFVGLNLLLWRVGKSNKAILQKEIDLLDQGGVA